MGKVQDEWYKDNKHSFEFFVRSTYNGITKRGKEYGINLTRDEFEEWLLKQELAKFGFGLWRLSNYNSLEKPSVDRIDEMKGYSLDNIQLITWGEHKEKGYKEVYNCKNKKPLKAITGISKEGDILKFDSARQAGRALGISDRGITRSCRGKYYAGGYKWTFDEKR